MWTTPNIKDEKCFYPKLFIYLFVCKTMCFYLKWCVNIKIQLKKNTKSQLKKIVCEIVNFGSTKLTKPKKKKKNLETQHNGTTFL